MSNFKVGDIVVADMNAKINSNKTQRGDYEVALALQAKGRMTVTAVDGDRVFVDGQEGRYYLDSRFKLASETAIPHARKSFIISVIIDGKFAPAQRPAEYASAAQARAVARSMAEKHPGSTFVVFEAVGAAYVAPVPKADFVTL